MWVDTHKPQMWTISVCAQAADVENCSRAPTMSVLSQSLHPKHSWHLCCRMDNKCVYSGHSVCPSIVPYHEKQRKSRITAVPLRTKSRQQYMIATPSKGHTVSKSLNGLDEVKRTSKPQLCTTQTSLRNQRNCLDKDFLGRWQMRHDVPLYRVPVP